MGNDDITVEILRDIRDRIGETNTRLGRVEGQLVELNERVDHVEDELVELKQEVAGVKQEVAGVKQELREFKAETRANFGGVLHVIGTGRVELDRRVSRIEDHLGLSHTI